MPAGEHRMSFKRNPKSYRLPACGKVPDQIHVWFRGGPALEIPDPALHNLISEDNRFLCLSYGFQRLRQG